MECGLALFLLLRGEVSRDDEAEAGGKGEEEADDDGGLAGICGRFWLFGWGWFRYACGCRLGRAGSRGGAGCGGRSWRGCGRRRRLAGAFLNDELIVGPDGGVIRAKPVQLPQFFNGDAVGIGDAVEGLAVLDDMDDGAIVLGRGGDDAEDVLGGVRGGRNGIAGILEEAGITVRGDIAAGFLADDLADIEDEDIAAVAVVGDTGADVGVEVAPLVEHDLLVGPVRPGAVKGVVDRATAGPVLIALDGRAAAVAGPGDAVGLVAAAGADMAALAGIDDPLRVGLGRLEDEGMGVHGVITLRGTVGIDRSDEVVGSGPICQGRGGCEGETGKKGQPKQNQDG